MGQIRLQKFLSQAGVCSRRRGEDHILEGDVSVNGRVVSELGAKVDPEKDQVIFRGKPVRSSEKLAYIALYKPEGYVSSCDQKQEKIVLDLVDIPQRIYPVGRLDKDSAGLLLLTNDGRLHQLLSHPSFDHEKEYVVTTARPLSDRALAAMAEGMMLEGKMTRSAAVKRLGPRRFRIVLKEGRNRQIRKMVGKTGNGVKTLKRIRIAHIRIGDLHPGQWRHLTRQEVGKFGLKQPDVKKGTTKDRKADKGKRSAS